MSLPNRPSDDEIRELAESAASALLTIYEDSAIELSDRERDAIGVVRNALSEIEEGERWS